MGLGSWLIIRTVAASAIDHLLLLRLAPAQEFAQINRRQIFLTARLPEEIKCFVKEGQVFLAVDQDGARAVLKILARAYFDILQTFHPIHDLGGQNFQAQGAQHPAKEHTVAQQIALIDHSLAVSCVRSL